MCWKMHIGMVKIYEHRLAQLIQDMHFEITAFAKIIWSVQTTEAGAWDITVINTKTNG